MAKLAAVILAAGKSTRMQSELPKVLHEICGKPVLSYVFEACRAAGVEKIFAVIGYKAQDIKDAFANDSDVLWVEQADQKGTAHAVLCCDGHLEKLTGKTLVLCGDGPLIRTETLKTLIKSNHDENAAATLATAVLDDPTGYGRIVRSDDGQIEKIVEHNDCTAEQLKIKEVNPSYYIYDNQLMRQALQKVENNNAKGEYYLTDTIAILIGQGQKVTAVKAVKPYEAQSINTKEQLKEVEQLMLSRQLG